MVALMNQHAVIGGAAAHWGPSAFADTMSALFGIFSDKNHWREEYNFINDAGSIQKMDFTPSKQIME